MLYEIGEYVWLDVGAYDAPIALAGAVIGARIMDASAVTGKYLVGTLAKQFPPRWVSQAMLRGRMPETAPECQHDYH